MNLPSPPPAFKGRLLGATDSIIIVIGFFGSIALPLLLLERRDHIDHWFLVSFFIFCSLFCFACLFALFSKIEVNNREIKYRFILTRRITWDSITEFRFLGLVPNLGFTSRIFVRTKGRQYFLIPISSDTLLGYFHALPEYKAAEQDAAANP